MTEALDAVEAALRCHLSPSPELVANCGSSALRLVRDWIHDELISTGGDTANIEEACRGDRRYRDEVEYQASALAEIPRIDGFPLDKKTARRWQYRPRISRPRTCTG